MRCLLIYPKFPRTFWSFERVLELVGRKVLVSPLGLPTVAALLPDSWEFKLVDRNIRPVTEDEWAWADIVLLSAMIVQRADMADQISEAKKRGKPVAVGGPYPTSVPEDMERAGADYLVLDEAELTLPLFLEALEKGETGGTFTAEGEKPDVTSTPVPRFDLYELEAYDTMAIQYSRGCPFLCEFCDIITLYGRRPRTKSPQQILAELDLLYELGWRRSVLMVDDNFIGNKKNAKQMLRELLEWQKEKGYPFTFNTEASIDLAEDKELMRLMVACNFDSVFLGIETPDEEALTITRKYQNTRKPMADSVQSLIEHGLRPMGGFIIGFDGEKRGAGDRIVQFINDTAIPTANFSMLQALPNTALWDRLTKENRLLNTDSDINQTSLPNYVPQRPMEELAHEYVEAFAAVYDPDRYLDRVYQCFLKLGPPGKQGSSSELVFPSWIEVRALLILMWRQGIVRGTRWKFWHHLFSIGIRNGVVLPHYVAVCAHYEHFIEYRDIVRSEIEGHLDHLRRADVDQNVADKEASAHHPVLETMDA